MHSKTISLIGRQHQELADSIPTCLNLLEECVNCCESDQFMGSILFLIEKIDSPIVILLYERSPIDEKYEQNLESSVIF